jgi:dTDP-4-amino-4,6-dideoxygalactose transaminase
VHYPCSPDFTAFQRFPAASLDRSREFAARAITLPLFPTMTIAQVDMVGRTLYAGAGEEKAHGAMQPA